MTGETGRGLANISMTARIMNIDELSPYMIIFLGAMMLHVRLFDDEK